MHKIFIGYDYRQPISFTVLSQSIIAQTTESVSIIPLKLDTLPIKRQGLTPFTYSRFLVPYLCEFKGVALFLDVDIVLNGDISELFKLFDDKKAIQVSKNENKFEWASVMLFNCAHPANACLTPELIESHDDLHRIGWCKEEDIGDLPREWNHLVGYDTKKEAKLIHYTQGVPAYVETSECEYSDVWHHFHQYSNFTQSWVNLMGPSIHSLIVKTQDGKERAMPKFLWDLEKGEPKPEYLEQVKKILSVS